MLLYFIVSLSQMSKCLPRRPVQAFLRMDIYLKPAGLVSSVEVEMPVWMPARMR
jgi:hypothetical protein